MPWKIKNDCVYKKNADGSLGRKVKCYPGNPAKARKLQKALYANVTEGRSAMSKKERMKARARRLRQKEIAAKELAELEELEDGDMDEQELIDMAIAQVEDDEDDEDVEIKEKSYDSAASAPILSPAGAMSWDEMDAAREALEKQEKVVEATYSVQDMVRNILWNNGLDPTEKANYIKAVGDGFGMRVQEIMDKPIQKMLAAVRKMGIGTGEKKERGSSIFLEKDDSGGWRWVGWVSNNYQDYDGEIISEAAHKEYAEWLRKNMDLAPVFGTWHIPGTARKNPVDYADCINGFLIVSGKLEEDEAIGLMKAAEKTDIGMSHISLVAERNKDNPKIVEKYRMVEATDLPLKKGANPFTDFETIRKEAGMNETEQLEYLASILQSEEKARKILDSTKVKKELLDEAGIKSAEKAEEAQDETKAQGPAVDAPVIDIKALAKAVGEEFDMEALSTTIAQLQEDAAKVPVLEALVKDLTRDNDEQLAEKIAPPITKAFSWSQKRASQKADTVLNKDSEEDQELDEAKPKVGWLSQISGTEPVQVS